MTLERFGFCAEGEAWRYIAESGLDLDSPLPVNTNGGLLSEAHLLGYGHIDRDGAPAARHRRAAADSASAAVVQWATPRGDSLVLTR